MKLSMLNVLDAMAPVETWLPKKKAFAIETPTGTPPLHALVLLSGHRGCGKGVALTSILRHYKRHGCADRIFWISPTIGSNKQYLDELQIAEADRLDTCDNAALQTVIHAVETEGEAWEDYLAKLKTWKKLHSAKDVDSLPPDMLSFADRSGLLEETAERPKSRYGHKPVLHMVLDDAMGTPVMSNSSRSKLTNLCIKHRHLASGLGCSIWLCVQSYKSHGSVPRPIRENATGVVVFNTPQERQVEQMSEELSDRRGPELFMECYTRATTPDHGFLFIDLTKKTGRYRAGWNEVLDTT